MFGTYIPEPAAYLSRKDWLDDVMFKLPALARFMKDYSFEQGWSKDALYSYWPQKIIEGLDEFFATEGSEQRRSEEYHAT